MQDKLQKLEDKVNGILMTIWGFIVSIMHKIIPAKFFSWVSNKKRALKEFIKLKIEQLKVLLIKTKDKLIHGKDFVTGKVDAVQNFPIKEKVQVQVTVLKEYLLNTPLKNHVLWFSEKFEILASKLSNLVDIIGKQQLAIAFSAVLMIGVGIVSIYDSSRDIYQNEFQSRAPASAQEYDEKPVYHMFSRKTAKILKIQVPIFRKNVNQIRNITVDFTVRTSTRFAKQYIEFHSEKLADYFYTSVEPVTSSFPIQEEGKIVLKEKIEYELNNFLKDENVEGYVEEVNITYLSGY